MQKNKILFFFLFFIFTSTTYAQNQLDSLVLEFLEAKENARKIQLCIEISEKADQKDSLLAYEYVNKARMIANTMNSDTYLALAYATKAILYRRYENYAEAKKLYKKAIRLAEKNKNDTLRADFYFELAMCYKDEKDFDKSVLEYIKALELHKKLNNLEKLANTHTAVGLIYKSQSKYLLSINNFEQALKIYETLKDTVGILKACNNIGAGLTAKFDYGQAFSYYLRVVKLLDRDKNYKEYARALSNIGILHRYNKEYDLALDYFIRSLNICKEESYEMGVLQAEFYIGYSYIDMHEYNKALLYMQRVLDYALEARRPMSLALRYRAMGDIYFGLKNLKKSLSYYNLSLKYSKIGQNSQYIIFAHLKKANLFYDFKQYEKANEAIDLGLEQAVENTYLYLQKNCYLSSAKIKFSLQKYNQAYQHMHKAFLLQDDISVETQKKGLTDAQAMFRTNLLQQENELQEKQLEAKNAKISEAEANSRFKNLIIIVAIILFIVVFVFASIFSKKNKEINLSNKELEVQNSQILKQKQVLQKTVNKLSLTQKQLIESEKMASLGNLVAGVAHEMNTPIGISVQAASGIVNRSNQIVKSIKENKLNNQDLLDYIEHTSQSSKFALKNLERTSELIKSFKLVSVDQSVEEKRGFNVKRYFSDILLSLNPKLKERNVSVKLECSETLEINSYPGVFAQIFTNFVINSITHGFTDLNNNQILVTIEEQENGYKLVYKDNGDGMAAEVTKNIFEPFFTTNKQTGTGLGMHIVYNLVTQKLNGSIQCVSEVNKGVDFIIQFAKK